LTDEFPEKGWTKRGVNKLSIKLRDTGTVDRQPSSCRLRGACTKENVETVNDLVLSQEDKPQTHRTVREILRETGIQQSSLSRIISKDMHLKFFKRCRAQELTDMNWAARMKPAKLLTLPSLWMKRCSWSLHQHVADRLTDHTTPPAAIGRI